MSRPALGAASLPMLCALALGDPPATELVAVHPFGDPSAMAISEDETRAYVAEGASIAVLDLALLPEPPAEIARVPVDATILALVPIEEHVFICGGSFGLLALERGHPERGARTVDDPGDAVCTDAARLGDLLAATFAARGANELRLYSLGALERRAVVPLPEGTAYAIAARGGSAWIAMGTGGLVRVDVDLDAQAHVLAGPRGAGAFPPPASFLLEPGLVRDVAIDGDRLFAAADAAGLATVALDAPWSPRTPVALTPIAVEDAPAYAVRVDARAGRVALAAARGPVLRIEGAPYGPNGIVGADLSVGGVDAKAAPMGRREALLLLEEHDGVPRVSTWKLPDSGWLSLQLGRERSYEQHLKLGFVVRSLDRAGAAIFERRPHGVPATDGVLALRDPCLVLFGTDSAGSVPDGLLRIEGDRVALVEPRGEVPRLGLSFAAQWLGRDAHVEWLVGGLGFTWSLWRIEHGSPAPRLLSWPLLPPADALGVRGHTYFNSAVDGDLVLLTRHGTRAGAVGYSAAALASAAEASEPGTPLAVEPLFDLALHGRGRRGSAWRADFATLAGGRRIAAIAAGCNKDPESPFLGRSRLVLLDVSAGTQVAPELLGAAHGDEEGFAIAVKLARSGERTLALAADLVRGLLVFDVSEPRAPRLCGRWSPPPGAWDGRPANVLDLELVDLDARRSAYLAAGRLGLVRVDVTQPDSFELQASEVIDTPGLATGLAQVELAGRRLLVLGDQRAGLRVYAVGGAR